MRNPLVLLGLFEQPSFKLPRSWPSRLRIGGRAALRRGWFGKSGIMYANVRPASLFDLLTPRDILEAPFDKTVGHSLIAGLTSGVSLRKANIPQRSATRAPRLSLQHLRSAPFAGLSDQG